MKTSDIEFAVAKYFNFRKNLIVPNVSWGFNIHECDLLIVRKSGYAIEVEIKISKSDFKADFKKIHKHIDIDNRICEFYYVLPQKIYDNCKNLIPNNAGVIVCDEYVGNNTKKHIYVKLIRKSKRIKGARKLTNDEQFKLLRLGNMRIWNLKKKLLKT